MSDLKERIASLNEAAKADPEFSEKLLAALKTREVDTIISAAAEKGIVLTAEDFDLSALDGKDVDDAELAAVAGGRDRIEEIDEHCGELGALGCGFGFGVALWSPGL